jgi:predicted transcriptional regulator
MAEDDREYLPDGDELRRRRQALGWSQRKAAAMLRRPGYQSRISYIETGTLPVGDDFRRMYVELLEEHERIAAEQRYFDEQQEQTRKR